MIYSEKNFVAWFPAPNVKQANEILESRSVWVHGPFAGSFLKDQQPGMVRQKGSYYLPRSSPQVGASVGILRSYQKHGQKEFYAHTFISYLYEASRPHRRRGQPSSQPLCPKSYCITSSVYASAKPNHLSVVGPAWPARTFCLQES